MHRYLLALSVPSADEQQLFEQSGCAHGLAAQLSLAAHRQQPEVGLLEDLR